MGMIAEKRGHMRCDMKVQVVSTPISWGHSHKLTSKKQSVITNVSLVSLDWNILNNYDIIELEEIKKSMFEYKCMHLFSKIKCIFKYKCRHINAPPEDGKMIEMTLSSRHRIRNSSPGGLRPGTLPLGHGGSPQY